mgnify:FL=1|jgi:hypothetical protein
MKKLIIKSVGVIPFANFLGLLGVVTGIIATMLLPVLALVGTGGLVDVDTAIKSVSSVVTGDLTSVVTLGIGGWIGGAAYAWIANVVLGFTKGVTFELK